MQVLGPSTADDLLDGPFRPNQALDQATRLAECTAPDNLVWQDDHLLFTSEKAVLLLEGMNDHVREVEEILRFETNVTAMAAAKDGSLAVGLGAAGIVIVGGEHDGKSVVNLTGDQGNVPTALCFADPNTLFVGLGSLLDLPMDASKQPDATGSVWRLDLRGVEPLCLADEMAFPSGLLLRNMDRLVISAAWQCQLLECSTNARRAPRVLRDDLPGHPGRLVRGSGGIWLPIFALRSRAGRQAPYGLIARLNEEFAPEASLHGAHDGQSRGVTSCLQVRNELIVACRSDNVLLAVDLAHQTEY